jgi:hypothetical protein
MVLLRRIKTPRSVALAGALGALALLLGWGFGMNMKADAHTPHPGLNFSISAEGQSGCDTSAGDAVCYIAPGTEFTIDVMLGALPSDVPSYEGYDTVINYTGLTSADDATTSMWPDCAFPASFFDAGKVAASCAVGIPPAGPSTYTGVIATNTFTCSESGTITLAGTLGNTSLDETNALLHSEGADETLNITCGSPPTPTATAAPAIPTALPGTGTAGVDQSGSTGIWLAIAALMTVAIVGLSAFGWKYARSAR